MMSIDPVWTSNSAASNLGLHCLLGSNMIFDLFSHMDKRT